MYDEAAVKPVKVPPPVKKPGDGLNLADYIFKAGDKVQVRDRRDMAIVVTRGIITKIYNSSFDGKPCAIIEDEDGAFSGIAVPLICVEERGKS